MNVLSRFRVPVQIGAGFFVAAVLLGIVTALAVSRVHVMRARSEEATALAGIATLTRDVMAQMLDESAAVRGYVATGDRRYLASMGIALQVEDVLTTAGQTHNALAIVFGIGVSTIHNGSASY